MGVLSRGNLARQVPRIEAIDIVMQFPAARALDGVSLTFEPGEVHAVIGENGAGKSTLMRILAGLQQPTSGRLRLDGSDSVLRSPAEALRSGIAMIHQELNLVDELSVAANVFLGREKLRGIALDEAAMRKAAEPYLAQLGAAFSASEAVGGLSIAARQLVEIAKALACEASVLIMDEPTAVLSAADSQALFDVIRSLKQRGTTVLYISHRLAEVEEIADRITVLRDGKLVKTLDQGDASAGDLASLMVGRPLGDLYPPKSEPSIDQPVLEVVGLGVPGVVQGATFQVRAGEILGLAGLVGAGRTELAEAIVGAKAASHGQVIVKGREVMIRSVQEAAQAGIAYVSEDRKDLGLHLSLSTVFNTTMANVDHYARPAINVQAERKSTEEWIKRLQIRVGDLEAPAMLLSGGNQQKVAVAKWLERQPIALILDEPTRGVDVGAKAEMYSIIAELASNGVAIVVISSELNELIGLCHRILVVRLGEIVCDVPAAQATEDHLIALATGVAG